MTDWGVLHRRCGDRENRTSAGSKREWAMRRNRLELEKPMRRCSIVVATSASSGMASTSREFRGRVCDERGLVALAAHRNGREIGAIGFEHERVPAPTALTASRRPGRIWKRQHAADPEQEAELVDERCAPAAAFPVKQCTTPRMPLAILRAGCAMKSSKASRW